MQIAPRELLEVAVRLAWELPGAPSVGSLPGHDAQVTSIEPAGASDVLAV